MPHTTAAESPHPASPPAQTHHPDTACSNPHTDPLHTASAEERHDFSHTWLDRGGAERDLMELNGWTSPQMLARYGASARGARARRSYDRIMDDT